MNDNLAQHSRADALAVDRLAAGDAQSRQRDVEREFCGVRPCPVREAKRAAQMAGEGAGR